MSDFKIKKIISVVLIVATVIANNGFLIFADSVDSIVNETRAHETEIPNYYYEQTTTIEEYQTYLEMSNPEVKSSNDNKDNQKEIVESEQQTEDSFDDDKDSESSETVVTTENEEETETHEIEESESEVESSVEIITVLNTEDVRTSTSSLVEEEEIETTAEDETVASDSEIAKEEMTEEVREATESEILIDEEVNVATESEAEALATESEATLATDSELEKATESEIEKEKIIATVSKVTWRVKKVLIATFGSVNTHADETEETRKARLATYANVIIVNSKGEEKIVKVNLKWQLFKKYEVNAKSKKTEAPIPKDEWRKQLKVDDFINEQENENVIATSNVTKLEEKVKEENEKLEDKEYVITYFDKNEVVENETSEVVAEVEVKATEASEETESVDLETIENIIVEATENILETEIEEPTVAGFTNTEVDETEESAETETETETEVDDETEAETETEVEAGIETETETQEETQEETLAETLAETDSETETDATVETEITDVNEEITDATEEVVEEVVVEDIDEVEVSTMSQIEDELKVEALTKDGEISDKTVGYYDLQTIYLYKVDVQALGNEIIDVISGASSEDVEDKQEETKDEGLLSGILNLFGFGSDDDAKEDEETDDLLLYLAAHEIDVIEKSSISPMFAEQDAHLMGAGATHTSHSVGVNVKGTRLNASSIAAFDTNITSTDILDLSASNRKIKASGSNILISGNYFLPADAKISNEWIVTKDNTLAICLNGHNLKFATAGCIKGEGRVVLCNCGEESTISTDGPQLDWIDKWYKMTKEKYIKYNEHSLLSGKYVGVYAKDGNINFANSAIKNNYVGQKALAQMETNESDIAEWSGDGSVVWATDELHLYGVKFTNNVATRSIGVAANAQLGTMILEDCVFTANRNLTNRGGAVAFNPKATVIYNCTFKDNVAATNGGALYGKTYTTSKETENIGTIIEQSTFEGNIAQLEGGAIFMDYLCDKGVTIKGTKTKNAVFKGNLAGQNGGAIAVKHNRSVDGENTSGAVSYEDPTSRTRKLTVQNVTFDGNAAKSLKVTNGVATIYPLSATNKNYLKDNQGGAVYLDATIKSYSTFPSDKPIKTVKFDNCAFTENYAQGYPVDVNRNGLTASFNVGGYGGALYVNTVEKVDVASCSFTKNFAMTGGNICVANSEVNVTGGELKEGKAYKSNYSESEFYKLPISPGGGAAYVMQDGKIKISEKTVIDKNENAFYLDGGNIDLGASKVTNNKGEYLIGYCNYRTNKILFSGVDIQNHTFNESNKDYTSTLSEAEEADGRKYVGYYMPSYISFKDVNVIMNNTRNYYKRTGSTFAAPKFEDANLVMTSYISNLTFDLKDYYFDVPGYEERIGLYYDFDPNGEDQVAYTKWTSELVKNYNEGGIWTNYFEIDNSKEDGNAKNWAKGWKFFIDKNYIRMSPHILSVKFDSFIEDVPRIKPQFYNFRKDGTAVKIATPTEILKRDMNTDGKTLLGFLGKDKSGAWGNDPNKYVIWDFDRFKVGEDAGTPDNGVVTMVAVYTNDTITLKPCGCENGVTCSHEGTNINHKDRGTASKDVDRAKYMNYIEIATYAQFAYKHEGKKTQYTLSRDMTLTSAQARDLMDGGIVLNLNGKTLTYDSSDEYNTAVFDASINKENYEPTDAPIMICGIASPGQAMGTIRAKGNHKGAIFNTAGKDVYLSNLVFDGINTTLDSGNGIMYSSEKDIDNTVYLENVSFENLNVKEDLLAGAANFKFKEVKAANVNLNGGNLVKVEAKSAAATSLLIDNSKVDKVVNAKSLVGFSLNGTKAGTKVTISSSSLVNNETKDGIIHLTDDGNGADSNIVLKGNNYIKNNKVTVSKFLFANETTNGQDEYGVDNGEVIFENNTIPDVDNGALIAVKGKSAVFRGSVMAVGNSSNAKTKTTATVWQGSNTSAVLSNTALFVTKNKTLYNWYVENDDYTKPIFTQETSTKLKASDSVIELRLKNNNSKQLILSNWSIDNLLTEKEAEETFIRDTSYDSEGDEFLRETWFTYKRGTTDKASDIYMGSDFITIKFRLFNYKENVDERVDSSNGYTDAATQRVVPGASTLLDTPHFNFDTSRTAVMWEGEAYYADDRKTLDYSKECVYPQHTKNIFITSSRSVLLSGYIYNYNNKRHVHEGNIELWTEARNEGHLQASTSYAFLHNDMTLTHPLLHTPDDTYILCLNGHKLTIDGDFKWMTSNKNTKVIICDCQKTGSIIQKGTLTKDFINIENGDLDISDVTIGPFENISVGSFINTKEEVKTNISNLTIKEVKAHYTNSSTKGFVNIETKDNAKVENVVLKSNILYSNDKNNLFVINNKETNPGDIMIEGVSLESNIVSGNNGSFVSIEGYKNVTIKKAQSKGNTVTSGAPILFKGTNNKTTVVTLEDPAFEGNKKKYVAGSDFANDITNSNSVNFGLDNIKRLDINGGTFTGGTFDLDGKTPNANEIIYTMFAASDVHVNVNNVTFDSNGTADNQFTRAFGIDKESNVKFNNCTFKGVNISKSEYIYIGASHNSEVTFEGNTSFNSLKAKTIIDVNGNNSKVLLNGTTFTSNTVTQVIYVKSNADVIASGAVIKNTTGRAMTVNGNNVKLFDSEISAGTGDCAVSLTNGSDITIGGKVVVKGFGKNIDISSGSTIKATTTKKVNKYSEIYISAPNNEYNFFNDWGIDYLEGYNYHDNVKYAYLPSDLFKLDAGMSGRAVYLQGQLTGGNQKLWVGVNNSTEYATLIFYDKDIKGPKEIVRQYVKTGEVTKLDRVQVDYVSTISQVWMVESDGDKPTEQYMWRVYNAGRFNDFEVKNYVAGKTYYAYLTRKHIHKLCGPDSLVACGPNHADGVSHTEDLEFVQVGSNKNILVEASRSNYIGLSTNLTISQEAIDSMLNRDIVFCVNGFTLTLDKDVTINSTHNLAFTNCFDTGCITSLKEDRDSIVISQSGSGNTLYLYNTLFKGFNTNKSIVRLDGAKIVSENTTFEENFTTAANGMFDINSGTVYLKGMTFKSNTASGSTLLNLDFSKFTIGKIESIDVNKNKYTNKLVSLSGTGNVDNITVENNTILTTGGTDAYGAIYVNSGANITYSADTVIKNNSTAANKEAKGGALAVYGNLNFNGKMTLESNMAGIGGGAYVDRTGRLTVVGTPYFKNNEAVNGAAIYAEDWSRVVMDYPIYDGNKATSGGVVAFGNEYEDYATFKNHIGACQHLIVNIHDNATDRIRIDKNTLFVDNSVSGDAIKLNNVADSTIDLSYLNSDNTFKNFIEIIKSTVTIQNSTITGNAFIDSAIKVSSPTNVKISSTSVTKNRVTNGSLNISGGYVSVDANVVFAGNTARSGKLKEVYISGKGGFVKATQKLAETSRLPMSAYTNGIKVFEKWDSTIINSYDKPRSENPGKYSYSPENSFELTVTDDAVNKGYSLYKVGRTNSQDVYIGKENVDYIQLKFVDPENENAVFTAQNIKKGEETKLDVVNTLECDLDKQRWVATMSDGTAKTLSFTSLQTASSSKTIKIPYTRPHLHKVCGQKRDVACEHYTGVNHTEKEYVVVSNARELQNTTDEYVYLNSDITANDTVALANSIKGLCLNGHIITLTGSDKTLFNITSGRAIDICNCRKLGGITVTGDKTQTADVITSAGTLGIYNIKFYGMSIAASVINITAGSSYTENLVFANNTSVGTDGFIKTHSGFTEGTDPYPLFLGNATFENNKLTGMNPMIKTTGLGLAASTLSIINNTNSAPIVSVKNLTVKNELLVKNNTVNADTGVFKITDNGKVVVENEAVFENNAAGLGGAIYIEGENGATFTVNGKATFKNNKAKDGAAIYAANTSNSTNAITIRGANFDGNVLTKDDSVDKPAIIKWSGALDLSDSTFENHTSGNLISNIDTAYSSIKLKNITFNKNAGNAINLNNITDANSYITELHTSGNTNTFASLIRIVSGAVTLKELDITDGKYTDNLIYVAKTANVTMEDVNIANNTISGNHSALKLENVEGTEAVVNIKGTVVVYNNNVNASLDANTYFKAAGKVSKNTQIGVNITSTNQKIFEGWSKAYIENYGIPASKSEPRQYAYTPENSNVFVIEGNSKSQGYELYKAGTGDFAKVYMGRKDTNFARLTFVYIDEDKNESVINTQNVTKEAGSTTVDPVDSFEYELEKQTWLAPDSDNAYVIKWEFANTVNSAYNTDTNIRYMRKHIHKLCGVKLYDYCSHKNNEEHTNTVVYEPASNSTAELWDTAQYIELEKDIEFKDSLVQANLKGICLNGHKIIVNNKNNSFFSITNDISICDCRYNKDVHGAITVKDGETYDQNILDNTSKLNMYKVHMEDIYMKDFYDEWSYTTYQKYAINNSGVAYLEDVVFANTGNKTTSTGEKGLINDAGTYIIVNPLFTNIFLDTQTPLMRLTNNTSISSLSVIGNRGYGTSLINIVRNNQVEINSFVMKDNKGTSGEGLVYVEENAVLYLKEDNIFENNVCQTAGVMKIEGTVKAEKDLTFKNNTANNAAGAIYITNTGKLESNGNTRFIGNKAMTGAAIYGSDITEEAFKDVKNIYFEDNSATTRGVVYWSGSLHLATPTFAKHRPYNEASETGTREGLLVNNNIPAGSDTLILENPIFIDNNLEVSAITATNLASGSEIKGLSNSSHNNKFKSFIEVTGGNVNISGELTEGNNNYFSDSVIKVKHVKANPYDDDDHTYNDANVVLKDLDIENQTAGIAAVNISNGYAKVNGLVTIKDNKTDAGSNRNIYLSDSTSYLKGAGSKEKPSFIDADSVLNISAAVGNNAKVFEGWNAYNFKYYDKPEGETYVYTPEGSGIFEAGEAEKERNYEFYKKGIKEENEVIYLGDDFVKLTYYNDVEPVEYVEDGETYGTQNIGKGVATKLDRLDTHEYEIEKQEWYVGYDESTKKYDHLEKFADSKLTPTEDGANGVVETFDTNQRIKYHQLHIHKVCGGKLFETCNHLDGITHDKTEDYETEITSIDDLEKAEGYVVLTKDLNMGNLNRAINISTKLKGICLNGHIIEGSGRSNALLNIDREFYITDCRKGDRQGYLTADESYTQTTGLININTNEPVGIYNIRFKDIRFDGAGAAVNVISGSQKAYIDRVTFEGIDQVGVNGVLDFSEKTNVRELEIRNNTVANTNTFIKMTNNIDVAHLIAVDNTLVGRLIEFVVNKDIEKVEIQDNVTSGNGIIYINNGVTARLKGREYMISGNEATNGGAFYIDGELIVEDDLYINYNKATEKGGAFYISNTGKLLLEGTNNYIGNNEATEGSAVYAENISGKTQLKLDNTLLESEHSLNGVIVWGGKLEATNLTFMNRNKNKGAAIRNRNSENDTAILSNIKFTNNTSDANAIELTNVTNDSLIREIESVGNTFNSLIYANKGSEFKVTNIATVSDNTFKEAALAFKDIGNLTLNNIQITNNTTNAAGAISLNNTKAYSVGSLKLTGNKNTGDYGAAITMLNKSELETTDEVLINNNQSNGKGAIYLDGKIGVEAQSTKQVKINNNWIINKGSDTSNIYVANMDSYVYAIGLLNSSTQLGFTAGVNNATVFKGWNASYIQKYDDVTQFSYTPETSGIFTIDKASNDSKYEFYKSGVGNNIVVKLGSNFAKIVFTNAGKTSKYSNQNIEKNVDTRLDRVLVSDTDEKWIAPNIGGAADFRWKFTKDVVANYNSRQYIYKVFNYYLQYTAGSQKVTSNPEVELHEYGEAFPVINNPYSIPNKRFKYWALRTQVDGAPTTYAEGDSAKSICIVENGTAYLDAKWEGEFTIRFNANSEMIGKEIENNPSYNITGQEGQSVTLRYTYDLANGGSEYTAYHYNTKPDNTGTTYNIGANVKFSGDVTLYCIWKKETPAPNPSDGGYTGGGGRGGGRGGGGGGGGRAITSGGSIIDGIYTPKEGEVGPGIKPFVYSVDDLGNIRDPYGNIVGNIYLGDRVNEDGSFTDAKGLTHYQDGRIQDANGIMYNLDGSITFPDGVTYYVNGDVKKADGVIYHTDGSITYPDGSMKDKDGIIHHADGSITFTDGTTYYVNGIVEYADGTKVYPDGRIEYPTKETPDTPGSWNYDPTTNGWKFVNTLADGTREVYTDQWIKTKNSEGNSSWYMVNKDGNMVTGWAKVDGEYYYMSTNPTKRGEIETGQLTIDGASYTFDAETGALLSGTPPTKGLTVLGAKNHESGVDGRWTQYSTGERYFVTYFETLEGEILEVPPSNWFMIDGKYYFFDEYGIPKTGLIEYDEKYYYMNEDGSMLEGGEIVIDNITYIFDKATGACRTMRMN